MKDTLTTIVESYLSREHILLDVLDDKRGSYIRVVIDGEGPVTLTDTTRLSKLLRDSSEIDSEYPNGFRLEVTTPGIDYPLLHPFQFRKNINRKMKVSYQEGDASQSITAKMVDADEQGIKLHKNGTEVNIPYTNIESAKVKVSFK